MPINRAPFNALIDDSGNGLTGSIWNKAAIKTTLLDPIDAEVGTWLSYTPVWTTTGGTQPTLGSGYMIGRYRLQGKTCHVQLRLGFGATTTYGVGVFLLTLPVAFDPQYTNMPLACYLQDASVGAYLGVANAYLANQLVIYAVGAPNGVNSALPFAWASGDYIEVNGAYQIA